MATSAGLFICKYCNFVADRESKFSRHLETTKHSKLKFLHDGSINDDSAMTCDEPLEEQEDNVMEVDDFATTNVTTSAADILPQAIDQTDTAPTTTASADWSPFTSKCQMLLYCLMHSPTHHVSDEVTKFVMFLLRECGVEGVPSFSALKDLKFGDMSWEDMVERGEDDDGNPFWILKPSAVLKLAVSHPDTSTDLIRLPRKSATITHPSEGSRWRHLPFNAVETFKKGGVYHCEVTGCFVEVCGFIDDIEVDVMKAIVKRVVEEAVQGIPYRYVVMEEKILVPVSSMSRAPMQRRSVFEERNGNVLQLSDEKRRDFFKKVNVKAGDEVHVPVNLFVDDTGTHRSKRWLPLHCCQMQLSGLPLSLRQKRNNVKFVAGSEKVDMMRLTELVVKDIKEMSLIGYDAKTGVESTRITSSVNVIIADLNMVSTCCNHLGASATKFCPRCEATSETFDQEPVLRKPDETQLTVQRIDLRGTEADKKRLRKRTGVKEGFNCLWDVVNPHRDIPVGMLHLIPLGLTKHLVQYVLKLETREKIRGMCANMEDMTGSGYETFFNNFNSRQGKDMKLYLQYAPVNLLMCGIPRKFVNMMACLAKIQVVLNKTELTEEEIQAIDQLIKDYHQRVNRDAPALKNKLKTHMMGHIVDDIRMHGPPKGYNEDAFEKHHGPIRANIFNQNQKARSRDLANDYARMEVLEHVVTGGFFPINNEWTQASSVVLDMARAPELAKFMGKPVPSYRQPGEVTKLSRDDLTVRDVVNLRAGDDKIVQGRSITARNRDLVNSGEWVVYDKNNEEHYGQLMAAYKIQPRSGQQITTKAKIFAANLEGDKKIDCPVIKKYSIIYIEGKDVIRKACVIHDCLGGGCRMAERMVEGRKEQEIVKSKKLCVKHNLDHENYIVNVFHLGH